MNGWTVTLTVASGVTITQSWNTGTPSTSGQTVTFPNASYNANVASNGTVSMGFNASYSGTLPSSPVSNIRFNGSACALS